MLAAGLNDEEKIYLVSYFLEQLEKNAGEIPECFGAGFIKNLRDKIEKGLKKKKEGIARKEKQFPNLKILLNIELFLNLKISRVVLLTGLSRLRIFTEEAIIATQQVD